MYKKYNSNLPVAFIRRGSIIETFIAGEIRSQVKPEFPFPRVNY